MLRVSLTIVGSQSLKDKRRVVASFKERVISRFRVSAAEVSALDNYRYAVLGIAVVSNEAAHCDSVLAEVASVAANLPNAILTDRATEIVPFGEGGRGIQGGIEAALGSGQVGMFLERDDER